MGVARTAVVGVRFSVPNAVPVVMLKLFINQIIIVPS
jgi:hypothetical protein